MILNTAAADCPNVLEYEPLGKTCLPEQILFKFREKWDYELWKKGDITQEYYKARLCQDIIRRGKAQLELNLSTAMKDNKIIFSKYINKKRRIMINLHSSWMLLEA